MNRRQFLSKYIVKTARGYLCYIPFDELIDIQIFRLFTVLTVLALIFPVNFFFYFGEMNCFPLFSSYFMFSSSLWTQVEAKARLCVERKGNFELNFFELNWPKSTWFNSSGGGNSNNNKYGL